MKTELANWKKEKFEILKVEQESFPEQMQSDLEDLEDTFCDKKALCVVLKEKNKIIGYVSSAPLEKKSYRQYKGVKEDKNFGKKNTLYVESIAIIPKKRGMGNLRKLFEPFLKEAKKRGYKFLTHHTRTTNDLAKIAMKKLNAEIISEHHNWFGFKEQFNYLRITL